MDRRQDSRPPIKCHYCGIMGHRMAVCRKRISNLQQTRQGQFRYGNNGQFRRPIIGMRPAGNNSGNWGCVRFQAQRDNPFRK